ncbi:hypothetical protein [Clostridium sp.]|uniref:hypothetical protein n=1 Tax=Clostridium sp. TaxID=1506 RepID=UPI003F3E8C6E
MQILRLSIINPRIQPIRPKIETKAIDTLADNFSESLIIVKASFLIFSSMPNIISKPDIVVIIKKRITILQKPPISIAIIFFRAI